MEHLRRTVLQVPVTTLPWAAAGYKLAVIISYPTSKSGIIVLLSAPLKHRKRFQNRIKNTPKIMCTLTIIICSSWFNGSYIVMAKPNGELSVMFFLRLLGKRASVGYEDGTLKVWDLRQGMHTFHLSGNYTVLHVTG